MNTYQAKIEEKKERYQELADKASKRSEQAYSTLKSISNMIPMGQPILVGHYSEGRHRRDLERMDNGMRKSIKEDKKAAYYQSKANNYGSNGISSDNPDAITELKEKLQKMETSREKMKAVNADFKKCKGDIDKMTTVSETTKQALKKEISLDWRQKIPFPGYSLTNLGARIRSTKKRIEELERKSKQVTSEKIINNIQIVDNVEDNRVQIFFKGKPDEATRKGLKSSGFRWSPSNKCWQAYRGYRPSRRAEEIALIAAY